MKSNNQIVSGLIFDPIKNEIFYAEKESGAYCNNFRIKVSKKNKIDECLFATGGNLNNELDLPYRKSGCAALDMAYVHLQEDMMDIFKRNLNLWDIAAGIILIEEAGGMINKIDLNNNKNIKVIASSTDINENYIKN